jgi:hypothetical protein
MLCDTADFGDIQYHQLYVKCCYVMQLLIRQIECINKNGWIDGWMNEWIDGLANVLRMNIAASLIDIYRCVCNTRSLSLPGAAFLGVVSVCSRCRFVYVGGTDRRRRFLQRLVRTFGSHL